MFYRIVLIIVIFFVYSPSFLLAQQQQEENLNQEDESIDVDSVLRQARQLVQQGHFQQARQLYQTLLRDSPNFYLIHLEIAYTFLLEGNYFQTAGEEELARQSTDKGREILVSVFSVLDSELHSFLTRIVLESERDLLQRAQEYAERGQLVEARSVYRLLLFLIPNWIQARIGLINLTFIHVQRGEDEQASRIFEDFELRQSALQLARHSVRQRDFRQAVQLYELLIYLIQDFHLVELELGYTLLLQGEVLEGQGGEDERAERFQEAGLKIVDSVLERLDLELRPLLTEREFNTEARLFKQAQDAVQRGALHQARKFYSLLLFLIPDWETAKIGLLFMHARLGEKEEARLVLRDFDLEQLDDNVRQALINLGLSKSKFQLFFLPQFTFTTNLSKRTSEETVRIPAFGNLPFTLDTEEESGIGGRVITGFVFEEEVAERVGLRTEFITRYAKFENESYDELDLALDVSILRTVGNFQHSLAVMGSTTRVGQDDREERSIGWAVRTLYGGGTLSSRSSLSTSYISGYRSWRDDTDRRIVQIYQNVGIGLWDYGWLNVSGRFTDTDWFIRQTSDNQELELSTRFLWVNLPYIRPTIRVSLARRWYENVDNLFIRRRQDTRISTSVSMCITVWKLFGRVFCPRYSYTRNVSNIPLEDYYSHTIDVQFEAWTW